ncbi:MAG: flagellar basal-body MS-ring/collar protein FliF [Clostridia bacterium]|jgi:flagellar M-ring protein FliF|nr:flagellar basal-body MS-ring/collar protein FliF [Clostridia bacterium]
MNYFAQVWEQFKKIWTGLNIWQKATLMGVVFVAVIGLTSLLILTGAPQYEALYTNLDPRDASAITAKLKEQNVAYRLADEGKTIMVAAKDKYQLRLDMAGEINLQGIVGFESFNETRFGETDTDKRVRFLVALQGELTRTIEELDEVESAKVHIALPQPSLFIRNQQDTTASVLLRLKPYAALKPEQINSIMSFVSHSVEGLKTGNVTIMDVNGNLLSEGLAGEGVVITGKITVAQLELKNKYEQELSRSIQSMLEQMRGPGKAVVRANVDMDFDQVETVSELFGNAVLASQQTKEESSTGTTGSPAGNPADANMEGVNYGAVTGGESTYELTEETKNYEVSKTTETKVAAPGKIKRVSVSVLIDGEISEEEQNGLNNVVARAAGIDVARGDMISLVAMPFNNEAQNQYEAQMQAAERAAARREYIRMGLYGAGVLLAVGLLIFIFRSLKTWAEAQLVPSMQAASEASPAVRRDFSMALTPEAMEKKLLREQIEELVDTHPEDVAKVVKTWMLEE